LKEFICTLTDNFKVDHTAVSQYFLNGRGQPQPSLRLAKGDAVWAEVQFDGGARDITSAQISCGPKNWRKEQYMLLSGPVTAE
jgi:hypothetical protein